MTENKFEVNSTRTQQEEPVALIRVDRMYESLRYNDYSAQNGLGEIVDNSVEAKAAHIDVMVTVGKARKTGKKKATDKITEIAVVDDGCGMNKGAAQMSGAGGIDPCAWRQTRNWPLRRRHDSGRHLPCKTN